MKILTKSLLGAGAAAAALVSVASPALARDGYGDRDNIKAGDVIAGALIIGGLAAILTSGDNHGRGGDARYDPRYGDPRYGNQGGYGYQGNYGYDNRGNGRDAVNQCVNAAERGASRYGAANVTEIRDIDRTDYGYRVRGKIVIENRGGYGNGYGRDGDRSGWGRQNWHDDDRGGGWGQGGYGRGGYNRSSEGKFTCEVQQGRVVNLEYRGF